jgi:hypothetical protein
LDPLLLGLAAAFGLAASAGLNTTLPLLLVGALARFGLLTLAAPFDALSSDVALVGLLGFVLIEFLADKAPGFDSVAQAIQWPLAATAGAILFASQTSVISDVSPGLAVLVGLLTAGTVHGLRTAFRPMVTASTLGTGNPMVSVMEDVGAGLLVVAAILTPGVALILLIVLLAGPLLAMIWTARKAFRLRPSRRGGRTPQVATP